MDTKFKSTYLDQFVCTVGKSESEWLSNPELLLADEVEFRQKDDPSTWHRKRLRDGEQQSHL
jgi:hypothetical protein